MMPLTGGHIPAMTASHVDGPVLAPHHKVIDVSKGEGHAGDGHCFGLLEHQLQAVLQWYTLAFYL